MKEIKLTQGKFAIVDDADYNWLNQWKWYAKICSNGKRIYVARFQRINGKPTTIYMHRIITNCPEDKEVDHINGDSLDNRRKNLRIVTRSENSNNRRYNRNALLQVNGNET